jgi:hypothetical protein
LVEVMAAFDWSVTSPVKCVARPRLKLAVMVTGLLTVRAMPTARMPPPLIRSGAVPRAWLCPMPSVPSKTAVSAAWLFAPVRFVVPLPVLKTLIQPEICGANASSPVW